jgi:hypothetical protein
MNNMLLVLFYYTTIAGDILFLVFVLIVDIFFFDDKNNIILDNSSNMVGDKSLEYISIIFLRLFQDLHMIISYSIKLEKTGYKVFDVLQNDTSNRL